MHGDPVAINDSMHGDPVVGNVHGTRDIHEDTPECAYHVCVLSLSLCLSPNFLSRVIVLDPLNSTREDYFCDMLERECTSNLWYR